LIKFARSSTSAEISDTPILSNLINGMRLRNYRFYIT
jgi:hypothetical protein